MKSSDTVAGSRRRRAAADLALWLTPFAVFVAIYHQAIGAWWMNDDSMALLSLARHGILPHFYRPLVDLELPPTNLTPWFYAAYGIDLALGGLDARIAYIHNFVSWGATLAALTIALRRWLDPATVAVVLVWFVLAVPTSTVAELLCTRHYLEGLLASTLCVIAYGAYRRGGRFLLVGVSALLYAWATTAKEIYVPLGPLLVVHHAVFDETAARSAPSSVALDALRRLWRAGIALWPHIVVAGAYVAYRGYMLGVDRLLTGYGVAEWRTRPPMLLDLPATWEWAFQWPHWVSALWLGLLGVGIALWLKRSAAAARWRGVLFGFAVATAVLAPIYPVLGILTVHRWNPHYLFVPGLAFFALAGWASRQCVEASLAARRAETSSATRPARWVEIAVGVTVVFLAIAQLRSARLASWPWSSDDHIARYRVEGEYELYAAERSLIVDAIGPPWHHIGLRGIRQHLLGLPEGPAACSGSECDAALKRQRDAHGICVRFFSGPPRLERVVCST